jgi:formylglycine-generating enzyme
VCSTTQRWLLTGLVSLIVCPAVAQSQSAARVVSMRPDTGLYVESDQGFLMPFTETIPGTDIQFKMMPIPGVSMADGASSAPFWIGQCEVTLREYREYAKLGWLFRKATKRQVKDAHAVDAVSAPTEIYSVPTQFNGVTSLDCPAYSMTLYSAKQYTKWLSLILDRPYRLPTEAEWQHACLAGGKASLGAITDRPEQFSVYGGTSDCVLPVGSKQPNSWGLHDIYGNVSEWVITQFPNPSAPFKQTREMFIPSWVSKGGSYSTEIGQLNAERREVATKDYWDYDPDYPVSCCWLANDQAAIGFRIVCQLGSLDTEAMRQYWDCESKDVREWIDEKVKSGRMSAGRVDGTLPEEAKTIASKSIWKEIPELTKQNNASGSAQK